MPARINYVGHIADAVSIAVNARVIAPVVPFFAIVKIATFVSRPLRSVSQNICGICIDLLGIILEVVPVESVVVSYWKIVSDVGAKRIVCHCVRVEGVVFSFSRYSEADCVVDYRVCIEEVV